MVSHSLTVLTLSLRQSDALSLSGMTEPQHGFLRLGTDYRTMSLTKPDASVYNEFHCESEIGTIDHLLVHVFNSTLPNIGPRHEMDSSVVSCMSPESVTMQLQCDVPHTCSPHELTCLQEQVCELYQNLHTADNPELLTQFENIVLNVIHDVRHYQLENERLEKTYQREKDEHLKHLRRLEEEMEQQVQSVEERVRRQEKEKLESEKVELRNVLDSEIVMLQQNLTKLQADGGTNLVKGQEEHLNNLKKRLEEIQHENRMLKSELTDAQTNLALTRSQMTSVKQKLEEKNHELEVENKTVEDYLNEQDKLRRQLQMLHEANKTLLDTNDNLRELLDSSPVAAQAYKRQGSTDFELGALYKSGHSARSGRSPRVVDPGSPTFPRKGSVMSNYVDTHPGNRPPLLAFNTGMMPRFLNESCDEEALIEDLDSGHSTLRDLNDVTEVNDDTELDSISIQSDLRRGRRHKRHRTHLKAPEEEEDDSHDEMESDPENIPTRETNGFRLPERPKRSPSAGSRGSNRSQRSLNREDSVLSHSSRSSRGSSRRQLPALPSAEVVPAPPAPPKDPDRVHRIYMAGDAAVGKTSFIFRICKGKFVANLSSTLGMDFYTKMLDVDGNNTVMELWDTAGQERFRAMTRSYFRRADGVLLLYDVTYERSFLNVREWVNAIEEGAVKKLPIMLVGNKTDLRDEMEKQGRRVVRYEDGLRLSKEIDALFIETSAKDGSNITEAVIELTRLLRTNQDLEVKSVGMQIHEMSSKKNSSSCCGR
ncbi:hypothetical protein RRG08_017626 [Elysia crispata]|uniref:Ras and EF-hand domain-containing protein n=1 Tax=Elysia crispata TaxID=231223 RepID=A0AAE1DEB3_9GAST|nr:hypothetical protein RRG08_017626 [Elysia crispata]